MAAASDFMGLISLPSQAALYIKVVRSEAVYVLPDVRFVPKVNTIPYILFRPYHFHIRAGFMFSANIIRRICTQVPLAVVALAAGLVGQTIVRANLSVATGRSAKRLSTAR